jgi:hypothetical protein
MDFETMDQIVELIVVNNVLYFDGYIRPGCNGF